MLLRRELLGASSIHTKRRHTLKPRPQYRPSKFTDIMNTLVFCFLIGWYVTLPLVLIGIATWVGWCQSPLFVLVFYAGVLLLTGVGGSVCWAISRTRPSELQQLSYTFDRRCLCCEKILKHLGNRNVADSVGTWEDAGVHEFIPGYGSKHDMTVFELGLCDECIDELSTRGTLNVKEVPSACA